MRRFTTVLLAVFLSIAFVLSCGDDDDGKKKSTGPSGGGINVTVSSGMTPQITWDGGNVFSVTVSDPEAAQSDPTGSMYFNVTTPNTDGISSPITYGSLPQGALQIANKALVAGKKYTCSVARVNGENGYVEFTR